MGLAGMKLSGSLRWYGYFKIKVININIIRASLKISFITKYKLKEILLRFLLVPKGLEDPD